MPALHVTGEYTSQGMSEVVSRGIVAVSSAELVASAGEADAARVADENAAAEDASCVGETEYGVGLCVSRLSITVGAPVLLTIHGAVYVPVGAEDCDPVLRLDLADGTAARTFTPSTGTLVTARVAHTYSRSGTYIVTCFSASQCTEPGSGGAGEETEYEFSQTLTITATGG